MYYIRPEAAAENWIITISFIPEITLIIFIHYKPRFAVAEISVAIFEL